jgi:hypothetical protein
MYTAFMQQQATTFGREGSHGVFASLSRQQRTVMVTHPEEAIVMHIPRLVFFGDATSTSPQNQTLRQSGRSVGMRLEGRQTGRNWVQITPRMLLDACMRHWQVLFQMVREEQLRDEVPLGFYVEAYGRTLLEALEKSEETRLSHEFLQQYKTCVRCRSVPPSEVIKPHDFMDGLYDNVTHFLRCMHRDGEARQTDPEYLAQVMDE